MYNQLSMRGFPASRPPGTSGGRTKVRPLRSASQKIAPLRCARREGAPLPWFALRRTHVEVCPADDRLPEVRIVEILPAEVRLGEVRLFKVISKEHRIVEIRLAEVRVKEVRIA